MTPGPLIRISVGAETFTAVPHPQAPQTMAAFRALLPYRQRLIHVRWSGEAVWIPLGDLKLDVGFALGEKVLWEGAQEVVFEALDESGARVPSSATASSRRRP